jgi:hypothetical protein
LTKNRSETLQEAVTTLTFSLENSQNFHLFLTQNQPEKTDQVEKVAEKFGITALLANNRVLNEEPESETKEVD